MALPFYVSPEQLTKDKSDYARKMIARGRDVIALSYIDGILLIAENPSATLHKISEIYDRVAFAGVGKFNEFESLRMHGIRQADVKGYSYARQDVTARWLANSYSQILGEIFTNSMKPFEVEILVAQVGEGPDTDELYHVMYDGLMADKDNYVAMGGQTDKLSEFLEENFAPGKGLEDSLKLAARALGEVAPEDSTIGKLEVAVLDRNLQRRKFRRLKAPEVTQILES